MKYLDSVVARLELLRPTVLSELHPELRRRIKLVYVAMAGRVTPYCGYRGPEQQSKAKAAGRSDAAWLQSPHNYTPALACDMVLHPGAVVVRERKDVPGYPDLWDNESPSAVATWAALELAAIAHGLTRVTLARGERDRPHLQLPNWRSMINH